MVNYARRCADIGFAILLSTLALVSEGNAQQASSDTCLRLAKEIGTSGFDPVPTIAACEQAANERPDDSRLPLQLGRALLIHGDAKTSLHHLTRSHNQGNLDASYRIGKIHFDGSRDLKSNHEEAFRWFKPAADKGHPACQNAVGIMIAEGFGTAQNLYEGINWIRKAAEQGESAAQVNLGKRYLDGAGLTKDAATGAKWIRQAAEANDPEAQVLLGKLFFDGRGVVRSQPDAVIWFKKASDQGNPEGLFWFGAAKLKGWSTLIDEKAALQLIERSANAGYADAQAVLGELYRDGKVKVIGKDIDKAIHWFETAVRNGVEARPELDALKARASEERARQAEAKRAEVVRTPTKEELLNAYTAYLTVKLCHDVRSEYLVKLVTPKQFELAKRLIRNVEDLTTLSKSEKDDVWKQANEDMTQTLGLFKMAQVMGGNLASDDMRLVCQSSLASLEAMRPKPDASPKRDF